MTMTGPTAPTGAPGFPWRLETYSNITPFTVRDGATYLQELLELKQWLATQLVPYVDSEIIAYVAAFNDALDQYSTAFTALEAYTATQEGDMAATVTAFNTAAATAQATITALVSTVQASATAAAASATTAAGWASTEYNIQDTNVGTLIGATASATYAALLAFVHAFNTANGVAINVKSFGAKGDGTTDDTAAFNTALASFPATGGKLVVPQGHYIWSSEVVFPVASIHFEGAGRNSTLITTSSATNNGIHVGVNGAFTTLSGFSIENTGSPTAGAGILFDTTNAGTYSSIKDVYVRGFYNGIVLNSSVMGWLEKVVCEANHHYGILIQNDSSNACQWQLNNVAALANNASGIVVNALNGLGAAQITLGNWNNIATYQNGGYGIVLQGTSAVPVNDCRLFEAFLGNDANGGFYADSYGGNHILSGVFTELAGSSVTGIAGGQAATGLGHGIIFTSTNVDVSISGGKDTANSQCGIYTACAETLVHGRSITNCGQTTANTVDASHSGIYNAGGNLTVTGCSIKGMTNAIATATDTVLAVGNTLHSAGASYVKPEFITLTSSVVASNRQLTS